jgi:hypothetical protein
MIATACEEKVDDFALYLFTRYGISLEMMCSFRRQTSSDVKVGLNAKINPLMSDI